MQYSSAVAFKEKHDRPLQKQQSLVSGTVMCALPHLKTAVHRLTYWAVIGINRGNRQRLCLGKLYGNRLFKRYYFSCQTRPLLEKQQAGEFAAVYSALAPVSVKSFVVIRMHMCEKESCSVWGSPVVYGNCRTSTLQDVAVRHDLQQAEPARNPPFLCNAGLGESTQHAQHVAEREVA